ncbi:hypothetical protein Y88_3636 [Novosphingobium nitrogenifigens DSM 19370]|uniref:Uncharacterized protein n=1 Tax=Novosphingobium nitrogenifigens DSM 19370 TaxID=983920 RepID=F1ZD78_9SPHN|nr:hypothetical protein Y88_3636 [Novosphingobium nitrogenifigens DSM 19370]
MGISVLLIASLSDSVKPSPENARLVAVCNFIFGAKRAVLPVAVKGSVSLEKTADLQPIGWLKWWSLLADANCLFVKFMQVCRHGVRSSEIL